ncbi:MAG: trypsin-like serine protease [Myxococcota bacterium]
MNLRHLTFLCVLSSVSAACAPAPQSDSTDASIATTQAPIVGGEVVSAGAWPNVVWLENGCSGVLVHERLLVYAAHCGEEHSRAWVGDALQVEWDLTQGVTSFAPLGGTQPLELEVCRTEPHGGRGRDIAYCILKTRASVPLAPVLTPEERGQAEIGHSTMLVGFGLAAIDSATAGLKRSVETPIAGVSAHGEIIIGDDSAGSCFGDSGGPAFVRVAAAASASASTSAPATGTSEWRLAGILSGGKPGVCGAGYYTDVARNLPFLENAGFVLSRCASAKSTSCVRAEPNEVGLFESYSLDSDRFETSPSGGCSFARTGASPTLVSAFVAALWFVRRRRSKPFAARTR